jgi:predicted dithiol-disulfide oxidoreductase (DUF899 family)
MTIAELAPASELKPAEEMAKRGRRPFQNESAEYGTARTRLLAEEIELRRHIQRVAQTRRALPPGPEAKDYRFIDADGKERRFVELFGDHDTLFTYYWMYGPERERPCPMCTSFVGSLDIPSIDIEQQVAVAILQRSPVSRQLEFARERGWRNLTFYQTVGDEFARDYRALQDDGSEWAIVAVWKRDGDKVRLFWAAEGGPETADPGFDPHLAPDPTPLWNILDMTPGGRPATWYPKLEYGA